MKPSGETSDISFNYNCKCPFSSHAKCEEKCKETVRKFKGEVRRKMNFINVLGFVVLRDVVKVFPVSSSSFARKTTGRNRARSYHDAT